MQANVSLDILGKLNSVTWNDRPAGTNTTLYSINLTNGNASFLGTLGAPVSDVALYLFRPDATAVTVGTIAATSSRPLDLGFGKIGRIRIGGGKLQRGNMTATQSDGQYWLDRVHGLRKQFRLQRKRTDSVQHRPGGCSRR